MPGAAPTAQRHWCFDGSADSDEISITGGPEAAGPPESGSYEAVWLAIDRLDRGQIHPAAFARLIGAARGNWPDHVLELSDD